MDSPASDQSTIKPDIAPMPSTNVKSSSNSNLGLLAVTVGLITAVGAGGWFLTNLIPRAPEGDKSASKTSGSLADSQETLTSVKEVRRHVLPLNGKTIKIRATVVDISTDGVVDTPYLIIGDSTDEYLAGAVSRTGYGNPNSPGTDEVTIKVVPRPLGLTFGDIVEFNGVYDGVSNTLTVTDAKKVGKEPPK